MTDYVDDESDDEPLPPEAERLLLEAWQALLAPSIPLMRQKMEDDLAGLFNGPDEQDR